MKLFPESFYQEVMTLLADEENRFYLIFLIFYNADLVIFSGLLHIDNPSFYCVNILYRSLNDAFQGIAQYHIY